MTDRETIVIDCNAQYGRCDVVNKLQYKLERIQDLIERHKLEMDELLENPIYEWIMNIIKD